MTPIDNQADGRTDFDFVMGKWQIHNRRLRARLCGCLEWEEFTGMGAARPILAGLGNFDEVVLQRASGPLHGATLRLFNPQSREWSIYWSDSQSGILFPSMIGRFVHGVGEFYAQERNREQTVLSRFIWADTTTPTPHWEQALSADGGRTWETNWTMDFTRID